MFQRGRKTFAVEHVAASFTVEMCYRLCTATLPICLHANFTPFVTHTERVFAQLVLLLFFIVFWHCWLFLLSLSGVRFFLNACEFVLFRWRQQILTGLSDNEIIFVCEPKKNWDFMEISKQNGEMLISLLLHGTFDAHSKFVCTEISLELLNRLSTVTVAFHLLMKDLKLKPRPLLNGRQRCVFFSAGCCCCFGSFFLFAQNFDQNARRAAQSIDKILS